ncbi:RNase H domain-containing protein [Trichonephila clavipes]|uniref:RNase H domain-containing protein n=1 Tax=Trichonephila clavipes TaxID=2585209 RepID=A0A8X6VI94_TRICX|nr:RNase H domain-containing protein [Trichonephila clavipes]
MLGFSAEETLATFQVTSSVLKLGNIQFLPRANMDGTESCSLVNEYEVYEVSELLQGKFLFFKPHSHKEPSRRDMMPTTQEMPYAKLCTVAYLLGWLIKSTIQSGVGLDCVIYEEGVENVTFQHRLRDECSVFQAELLCINLVVKLIRDSLRQGGTLNFLICTDSLSSLHYLLSVNSIEKLVVEVHSILYYLDCDIHFSYVRGHSGNLTNDRADQLDKEATCQDMNLLMSVPLSHWKHVAREITVSS